MKTIKTNIKNVDYSSGTFGTVACNCCHYYTFTVFYKIFMEHKRNTMERRHNFYSALLFNSP